VALGFWPRERPFPRLALAALWAAAIGVGIAALATRGAALVAVSAAIQRGGLPSWFGIVRAGLIAAPFAAAAVAAAAGVPRLPRPLALAGGALGALGLAALAVQVWDQRPAFIRARETPGASAFLHGALKAGSVYWFDGLGSGWLWTGLPEWRSGSTGAGVVFDRELALDWKARRDLVVRLGLEPPKAVLRDDPRRRVISLTTDNLGRLCSAPNAPDWVLAERSLASADLLPRAVVRWRAPAPDWRLSRDGRRWTPLWDYVVFPCRAKASAGAERLGTNAGR